MQGFRRNRSTTARFSGRHLKSTYDRHFADPVQERRLLSAVGFLAAFATARGVTHAIHDGKGPFGNVSPGGKHIHHMTFGITAMLGTGYLWVNLVGTGHTPRQRRASRITATVFGAGAALTLDEFALWLNLEDDYWTKQGRESIDAVTIYGGLLGLGVIARRLIADMAHWATLDRRARRRLRMRRLVDERLHAASELVRDPRRLAQAAR